MLWGTSRTALIKMSRSAIVHGFPLPIGSLLHTPTIQTVSNTLLASIRLTYSILIRPQKIPLMIRTFKRLHKISHVKLTVFFYSILFFKVYFQNSFFFVYGLHADPSFQYGIMGSSFWKKLP